MINLQQLLAVPQPLADNFQGVFGVIPQQLSFEVYYHSGTHSAHPYPRSGAGWFWADCYLPNWCVDEYGGATFKVVHGPFADSKAAYRAACEALGRPHNM